MSCKVWENSELIGLKIDGCYINSEKDVIKIVADGRAFYLVAQADCCSESWFEHSDGFYAAKGRVVTGFTEVKIGVAIPTRQECDQIYKFDIESKLNDIAYLPISLELRNSSNGYYGGWVSIYDPSSGFNFDDEFKELSDDF